MRNKSLQFFLLLGSFMVTTASMGQSLNPFSIGRLSPGDSIVIYYDVTINNSCNCTQISNQGTITGSNFSPLNTDDPDTAPIGDATITVLNMFPLPVKLLELKAQPGQTVINVSWKASNEENFSQYAVERSSDGRNFSLLGNLPSKNSVAVTSYIFTDQHPLQGNNFYRLKMMELSGHFTYSPVVRVSMDGGKGEIKIYPNPVTRQTINLQLTNLPKGQWEIVFYNSIGQVAYQRSIYHDGGSVSRALNLPSNLAKGFYRVAVKSVNEVFIQSIFIQ